MKTTTIFGLMLCMSCGSPVTISYDYDRQMDFRKHDTYEFADLSHLQINQFDKDRIVNAIEKEMTLRDYERTDSADLIIDIQVKLLVNEEATATSYGGAYGPWGYGFSSGFTTTHIDINKYVDGTLFINVIDGEKQNIIWQGRGTKTLNDNVSPGQREANINKVVSLIFKKYAVKPEKNDKD